MSTATKPSSNGTSKTATVPRYEREKVDAVKVFAEAVTDEVDKLVDIASQSARATMDLLRGARFDADGDVDERLRYLANALVAARMVQEYVDHAADALCHDRTPTDVRDVFGNSVKELPF